MFSSFALRVVPAIVWLSCFCAAAQLSKGDEMELKLRYQTESSPGSGRFHRLLREESWKPEETAIIVCDTWDLHHCLNAVRRLEQFAPCLNQVLTQARSRGVTVIHSPSDCMDAYVDHPARNRTLAMPPATRQPYDINSWCSIIPSEERAAYPIDQSDGGEDDDPEEHAQWAAKLKALGRNPATPWKAQSNLLAIDSDQDYISDRGDEVWNILQSRNIRNVILTGVHTNMCVLGRPFGLRQMVRNGKNVVLMRDMTDTMYNPRSWPYVSHFTGTDLIISHIERFVCPTITSDQFLGGQPFRFAGDSRPHLVIVMAEDEYHTSETLPKFALEHLGQRFRVSMVYGSDRERNAIPGLGMVLEEADALMVSIRRRQLPESDMDAVRRFVASGKPVIGIRTASHAFSLRNQAPPDGFSDWPEFDAQVFGGNYHGHYGNGLKSTVRVVSDAASHPVLTGVTRDPIPQAWSLYQTSPLATGTTVLLTGRVEGKPDEPVAWTFMRADGGRSFYTSMGHIDDFTHPEFIRLLINGIHWAAGLPVRDDTVTTDLVTGKGHWTSISVPDSTQGKAAFETHEGVSWYRCVVRIPRDWANHANGLALSVPLPADGDKMEAWINGQSLRSSTADHGVMSILPEWVAPDDANLLVLRVDVRGGQGRVRSAPVLSAGESRSLKLSGRWQFRVGDGTDWSNMPLPSKFGTSTDIVFMPPEPLFVARPLTRPGEFTPGIEGPACGANGNVFAVNYDRQGTIGRVTPDGAGEIFVALPTGSVGNGIRFDEKDFCYVADYSNHNVLRINLETREITTLAHNAAMNQPNDLAIAPDGTIYASDPNWSEDTGQLWRIDPNGTTVRLAADMGTTNGIDVSPDGRTLYVNESVQRNIWAFTIASDGTLSGKRLVRRFDDHGFDGMRCDVDGNLYVTRYGKGTVVKLSPSGEVLQEIDVLGARPSNLCFGGPDGRTVYVTEVEFTRLVQFRVDRPGAAWQRWKNSAK